MENNTFYHEILIDHNQHPVHKHKLEDANLVLEGVNPSCGDDIFLKLKLDGDTIADGAFVGDGCAISQASADIMLGMIVGRKKDEALKLGETFLKMIQGEATEEEIDKTLSERAERTKKTVEEIREKTNIPALKRTEAIRRAADWVIEHSTIEEK